MVTKWMNLCTKFSILRQNATYQKQDFSHFALRIDSGKSSCYTQPERQVCRMLLVAKKCGELNFSQLMAVYEESNLENAQMLWQDLSETELLLRAEQAFYGYLQEDFFRTSEAYYAVWEEDGRYCSALRIEPYQDGVLLEALETRPDSRCRGYATMLMQAVLVDW